MSVIDNEKTKVTPNQDNIDNWQKALNDIDHYKVQGPIIRSKEKIIINEEKPTKYFYQQEKQTKKHINYLQNESNIILKSNFKILKECKNFYQQLHTSNFIQNFIHVIKRKTNYYKKHQKQYLQNKMKI